MMKNWKRTICRLLAMVLIFSSIQAAAAATAPDTAAPLPVASGTLTAKNAKATIDYSNTKDGYVMVNFTEQTDKRLKVRVTGPTNPNSPYTYDIPAGKWITFPLSDGNGQYKVSVFEHTGQGSKYATVLTATFTANLSDEFAPYLRPNQYVDYGAAPKTTAKAAELCKDITDPLKKVEAIYKFVVGEFTYDKEKAATVQSGYLPVLDTVLDAKTGICFDYAAVMAGMLRSQGVPCKLVIGYAGTTNPVYHAWISVWSKDTGWVEKVVYFDGKTWQRMDPTFASSAKQSESIMKYIGDGGNYSTKYMY